MLSPIILDLTPFALQTEAPLEPFVPLSTGEFPAFIPYHHNFRGGPSLTNQDGVGPKGSASICARLMADDREQISFGRHLWEDTLVKVSLNYKQLQAGFHVHKMS